MVNESFKQALWGEHLAVALCSLSRACHKCRNEQYIVITELCPLFCPLPLLPHWLWERAICMQLVWKEPVGAISVCHLIFPALYSVYSHSHMLSYPSSRLELVLGFCPYCEHAERFTVFVRGQISVVLGWEARWVSQDLLWTMVNDFFNKVLDLNVDSCAIKNYFVFNGNWGFLLIEKFSLLASPRFTGPIGSLYKYITRSCVWLILHSYVIYFAFQVSENMVKIFKLLQM